MRIDSISIAKKYHLKQGIFQLSDYQRKQCIITRASQGGSEINVLCTANLYINCYQPQEEKLTLCIIKNLFKCVHTLINKTFSTFPKK